MKTPEEWLEQTPFVEEYADDFRKIVEAIRQEFRMALLCELEGELDKIDSNHQYGGFKQAQDIVRDFGKNKPPFPVIG